MIIMKEIKTTDFFNDAKRLLSWSIGNVKDKEHSKVRGFFSKIFREMKR